LKLPGAHGGRRPGAGKPKGTKWPSTLRKEDARELVRQHITAQLLPMLNAQIAHAKGIGQLYIRDKNGKYTKIDDPIRVDELLATGEAEKDYWIFMKDPSVAAFTDLLNRAIDKPGESVSVEHSGGVEITWKE
jgi:hypothetical protein